MFCPTKPSDIPARRAARRVHKPPPTRMNVGVRNRRLKLTTSGRSGCGMRVKAHASGVRGKKWNIKLQGRRRETTWKVLLCFVLPYQLRLDSVPQQRLSKRSGPTTTKLFVSKGRRLRQRDWDIRLEDRAFGNNTITRSNKRKQITTINMSTTCLTIHDLLRITYTYEAQALEAQATMRKRSDSACSVSLPSSTTLNTQG